MKKINSKIKIVGEITARCYDQSTLTPEERAINYSLQEMVEKGVISTAQMTERMFFGVMKYETEKKNVICNTSFEGIGQILVGTYADTGEVNYMALGTGSTAVASSDVALETEVYRNATASGAVSGNVTYLTAFYNEAETTGTYTEFGNFIDATGVADSGLIWSHVLTGGWVKTITDVLIVDCKYTFTSS